jgi:hypothetical protein
VGRVREITPLDAPAKSMQFGLASCGPDTLLKEFFNGLPTLVKRTQVCKD